MVALAERFVYVAASGEMRVNGMSNETENTIDLQSADSPSEGDRAPGEGTDGAAGAEASPQQIQQWREQAGKAQEHWDRLVRVSADFDNYKKRAARERQDAIRFANESLIAKLIPVLDNFEAALAAAQGSQTSAAEALTTGVNMIYTQLRTALADAGLEEIDAAGKPFDPNWHEAVAQQPSADVAEGNVLQQVRKGFKLKDRLIRPATVVVAKRPAS
jgi:molecular chaperone GrpE